MPGCSALPVLSATEPTLQIGAVHDSEHQDHAVGVDDVIHHTVVADTQTMEYVLGPADGLDRLACYAPGTTDVVRESSEGVPDAIPACVIELPELSRGRTG